MVDLKKISRGKESRESRVVAYSFEGMGKTTFAVGAPDPFVIDADRGSHKFDVARVVPETWGETKEWLTAVEKGTVKCQSLVLDSLTQLEYMANAEMFPGTTISAWQKGFGRGDEHAVIEWRTVLAQLERIWLKGKSIVLVSHAVVKHFESPDSEGYERYELSLRPRLAGLIKQWADYVLFCALDVTQVKDEAKIRLASTGVRWAYAQRTPAYDAKARGTTGFPWRLALSWKDFDQAVKNDARRGDELLAEIEAMLLEISDASVSDKVHTYLKENPAAIPEAHNGVVAKLEEKRASATTQESK